MSAVVARGYGGDAGGDPPPNPNKIPTIYEATCKSLFQFSFKSLNVVSSNILIELTGMIMLQMPGEIHHPIWIKKNGKRLDFFVDSKFKDRSKKNAENRRHAKYSSLHGSTSYIATRYKKKNPETKELQGSIENFRDMHYRSNGGWVNDLAKEDHEAMLEEKASQTQDGSTSSSSLNEKGIITKVLGERRSHNRGIGRKLKGSAFSSFFEPPSPPPPKPVMNEGRVVDAVNGMHQYMHLMYNAFRRVQPNFQFPPPPTIDPRTLFDPPPTMAGHQPQSKPPAPPQQPPREDEDEEDDTDSDSYDD